MIITVKNGVYYQNEWLPKSDTNKNVIKTGLERGPTECDAIQQVYFPRPISVQLQKNSTHSTKCEVIILYSSQFNLPCMPDICH